MRIGMTNPPYILNHLHEIAKYLNHPRVYSFLHVPVQSGSDQVLYTMKREYTNADFCKVVDILREEVPGVNIATGNFHLRVPPSAHNRPKTIKVPRIQ